MSYLKQDNKNHGDISTLLQSHCQVIVRFDNDFAIKSKYHRDLCYLVLIAHILSLQEVLFGICFVLYVIIHFFRIFLVRSINTEKFAFA